MSTKLAQWLVRYRLLAFLTSIVIVTGTVLGLSKLEFTADYKIFFDKTNPQLTAYENIQSTYTKSDNLLFILAPKDANVFNADNLAAVEWLTEKSWLLPYSTRVESVTNFQHTTVIEDDLMVENLVEDALTLSQAGLG